MKYLIYILMLIVLYCLGSASFYMLKSRDAEKMAKALTWRIALSLVIFILLFVGFALGLLSPHQMWVTPSH